MKKQHVLDHEMERIGFRSLSATKFRAKEIGLLPCKCGSPLVELGQHDLGDQGRILGFAYCLTCGKESEWTVLTEREALEKDHRERFTSEVVRLWNEGTKS